MIKRSSSLSVSENGNPSKATTIKPTYAVSRESISQGFQIV